MAISVGTGHDLHEFSNRFSRKITNFNADTSSIRLLVWKTFRASNDFNNLSTLTIVAFDSKSCMQTVMNNIQINFK